MADVPARKCSTCGAVFPATAEHFYRKGKTGWRTTCIPCTRAALDTYKQRTRAQQRAERQAAKQSVVKSKRGGNHNPTGKGLDLSLAGKYQPKKPPRGSRESFRQALLRAADRRWDEIAERMIDLALGVGGERPDGAMLRYVGGMLEELTGARESVLAESLRYLYDIRERGRLDAAGLEGVDRGAADAGAAAGAAAEDSARGPADRASAGADGPVLVDPAAWLGGGPAPHHGSDPVGQELSPGSGPFDADSVVSAWLGGVVGGPGLPTDEGRAEISGDVAAAARVARLSEQQPPEGGE
jgi:hypothetical protein